MHERQSISPEKAKTHKKKYEESARCWAVHRNLKIARDNSKGTLRQEYVNGKGIKRQIKRNQIKSFWNKGQKQSFWASKRKVEESTNYAANSTYIWLLNKSDPFCTWIVKKRYNNNSKRQQCANDGWLTAAAERQNRH